MNLNEEDIFKIALSECKQQSINVIKTKLNHSFETISDNWRNEILFDCILDLTCFCLKKGFSLSECVQCCSIQYDLIGQFDKNDNISNKLINLASTLELFKSELIKLNKSMNDKKIKDFIDYINLTFITQFNLFKYVFTTERENQILNKETIVHSPSAALENIRLIQSKHVKLFDYDNKIAEIEKREKKLVDYFKSEREALNKQETSFVIYIKNDDSTDGNKVDEELIKKLINDISLPMTNLATKSIRLEFEEYKKREEIISEKKSLIKPEEIASTLKPKSGNLKDNKKSKKK